MNDRAVQQYDQYLTFTLDREVFALNIATVREVLEYTQITRIPRVPEFIRGVINLRGHAVPVIDMRLRFGLEATKETVNTCIIIVEVAMEGERVVFGALADSVREVVDLDEGTIEQAPNMGTAVNTEFIKGIGRIDAEFVMILEIDKVFSFEDLSEARDAGGNSTGNPLEELAQVA
jgi:purine-binding chemotaxis protein CheW